MLCSFTYANPPARPGDSHFQYIISHPYPVSNPFLRGLRPIPFRNEVDDQRGRNTVGAKSALHKLLSKNNFVECGSTC
jgi:hypothetical protein